MQIQGTLAKGVREWPVIVAVAGILSLAPVLRFWPEVVRSMAGEGDVVAAARERIETGRGVGAAVRLKAFLEDFPEDPRAAEAWHLLGRSYLLQAKTSRTTAPTTGVLEQAWDAFQEARRRRFGIEPAIAFQKEIFSLMVRRGAVGPAVKRGQELSQESRDPAFAREVARAWGMLGRIDPAQARICFDAAAACLGPSLAEGTVEDRRAALLAQWDVLWMLERYPAMNEGLQAARDEFKDRPEEPEWILRLGKSLLRLGREDEALETLKEAALRLTDPSRKGEALLFQTEALVRRGDPLCLKVGGALVQTGSPLVPFGVLLLGIYQLEHGYGQSSDMLRDALGMISSPHEFAALGFDFAGFYASLRKAWEREDDPAVLSRTVELVARIRDIFRDEPGYALDVARLWQRIGDRLADGNPAEALRCYDSAAAQFVDAAKALTGTPEFVPTCREAAEAYAAGGRYSSAAGVYRIMYDAGTEHDPNWIYRQAENLMRAQVYESPRPGTASALSVFAEYIRAVPMDDPFLPEAFLARARMLAELGRPGEALAEYDRILQDPRIGIDPRRDSWAEALLGRGRVLLGEAGSSDVEESRRQYLREGRAALREYIDRYGDEPVARSGVVEAGFRLAAASASAGEWRAVLEYASRLDAIAGRLPRPARADVASMLQEIRLLAGQAMQGLGSFAEAARVFGEVYRAASDDTIRLRALLGRARAYVGMGRREEARRDYQSGCAFFENRRGVLEKSLAGMGGDYWPSELAALEKEIQ